MWVRVYILDLGHSDPSRKRRIRCPFLFAVEKTKGRVWRAAQKSGETICMLENKSSAVVASREKRHPGIVKIRKSRENRSSLKYSPWSTSPFHCSAEWHLQDMGSRLTSPLYSWARRLSAKSESFFPSVESIAIHFVRDRSTVFRALGELVKEGWAEIIQREPGKPVTYRFITHKEWAQNNPDCCTKKDVMPWDGQGDPLGQRLYAASGGQAKFLPGQMTGLRKSGLSDDDEERWRCRRD
jgi:hypothetical protein